MKKDVKKLNIVYYSLLCILLLFGILNFGLGNMDELWNFVEAKNIANGLLPYRDFNAVAAPLSMFINGFLISIRPTLFTFRILYFVYFLVLIFLLDRIMNLLKVKNFLRCILIFASVVLLLSSCYLDYNFIQLILVLLLVYLSLKNIKYDSKKFNIIIPFVAGLTIINKQSTGAIICFMTILLILLDKKRNFKLILQYIGIMMIPSVMLLIYLLVSNTFLDFYDFCILGMTTFSNKLVMPIIVMIFIVSYVIMIALLRKYKNRELTIIFWYAVASLFTIIPIVDYTHGFMALILVLVFFVYAYDKYNKKLVENDGFSVLIIIIMIIYGFYNADTYISLSKIKDGVYENIPAEQLLINNINNVSEYVLNRSKDHDVHIVDFSSPLYNLNIDKYDKYFDLFMNGNFGVKGIDEIYNIIGKKNQIILINNTNKNWQRPDDIIKYAKKNYKKCDSIEQFDVYCN